MESELRALNLGISRGLRAISLCNMVQFRQRYKQFPLLDFQFHIGGMGGRDSVIEMDPSFNTLGSEFDDFLFAPIGEDKNGLRLSVLSALARRNIDPWQEAARLARMPEETAIRRLASLIAALPDMPSARLSSGAIAARLIALLPRRSAVTHSLTEALSGSAATARSRVIRYMIFYAILLAFVLGFQHIIAGSQSPPPPESATSQQSPVSNPGQ
jgi:hypothetical protein